MNNKERAEGNQLAVFIKLFNQKYGTDYELGSAEKENSIIDRRALSGSNKWPELKLQLKDIVELDTSPFKESIMGKEVKVFNLNIFKLLNPALKKIAKKYGDSAKDIILVLNVGVSKEWLKDYIVESPVEDVNCQAIYCLGLPSSIDLTGFIFPLKELVLIE